MTAAGATANAVAARTGCAADALGLAAGSPAGAGGDRQMRRNTCAAFVCDAGFVPFFPVFVFFFFPSFAFVSLVSSSSCFRFCFTRSALVLFGDGMTAAAVPAMC